MRVGLLGRATVCTLSALLLTSAAAADVAPRVDADGSRFAGEETTGVPLDTLGTGPTTGDADQARLDRERRSPPNKAARARDREAYADQDRDEALDTLSDGFPDLVNAPPWRPLMLADGDRLLAYTSTYTAKVDTAEGGTTLVDSQLPLRARDDGRGPLKPLSYEMQAGATSFQLDNPLVPVVINKDLDEGIEFPDQGFSFRPTGAASTSPPMRVGDKVLYANLVTDTDLFLVPTPTGLESVLHVRSADAPESSALQLDLGPGQRVEQASAAVGVSTAGYRIVDQAGEVVTTIPLPAGVDAKGRNVPVTMALEGDDKLVLHYPHNDPALQFPLVIDPVLDAYGIDPNSGQKVNNYDPFYYWDYWANDNGNSVIRKGNQDPSAFAGLRGNSIYGNGLYIYAAAANRSFNQGSTGEWIWPAPAKSFVRRADFGYVNHAPYSTCVIEGVYAPSRFAWDTGRWEHPSGQVVPSGASPWSGYSTDGNPSVPNSMACQSWTNNYKAHYISNPTPGNQVVLGMQSSANGNRPTQPVAYMYGASMWLDDNDNPSLGALQQLYQLPGGVISGGLPSAADGWVDTASFGVAADLSDPGLGAKKIDLVADGAVLRNTINPCTGGKDYRCPNVWPASQTNQQYTSAQLGPGIHNMALSGADAIEHRSAPASWQVKIDQSAPAIETPTGSLYDARNQTADHRKEGLYDATFGLSVTATDSHSGIASITATAVATSGTRTALGTTTSSPLEIKNFPTDGLSDGTYTIEIVARDRVAGQLGAPDSRHASTTSFKVVLDHSGDIVHAIHNDGPVTDSASTLSDEWLKLGTQTARLEDDRGIATRRTEPCPDRSEQTCEVIRHRTQYDNPTAAEPDQYTVTSGAPDDPSLEEISRLRQLGLGGTPDGSGTMFDLLETWQHGPPARGATYDRYDVTYRNARDTSTDPPSETGTPGPANDRSTPQSDETVRVYVDRKTQLPVRISVVDQDGSTISVSYFDYDVERTDDAEHPADFFKAPAPQSEAGYRRDISQRGASSTGQITDRQTNKTFTPWGLGRSVTGPTGALLCQRSNDVVTEREAAPGDNAIAPGQQDPDIPAPLPADLGTFVVADYEALDASGTCSGLRFLTDATRTGISVVTMRRDSDLAAAWRTAYDEDAKAVNRSVASPRAGGLTPITLQSERITARIVPSAEGQSSALFDIGDTTIMLTGPFLIDTIQPIIDLLRAQP